MSKNLSAQGGPASGGKIIGIIILVVALGVAGWFLVNKQLQNNADLTQKGAEAKSDKREEQNEKLPAQGWSVQGGKTEDIDTSNWKTYRNEELGFEMKYPEGWEIIKQDFPREHLMWKNLVLILNTIPINRSTNNKLRFTLSVHNTTQSPREWYMNHVQNPEYPEHQGIYRNMKINNLETYYVYEDKSYKSMNYVIKINENTILFIGFRPASSNIPYDFTEYIPQYQSFIQSIKAIKAIK